MVKTPCSQCRGPGFDPWSGNWIPHGTNSRCHTVKDIYLLIDYFPEPDLNCGTQDLCYSMHDATKQILHATTKIFYAITKTWNSQILNK